VGEGRGRSNPSNFTYQTYKPTNVLLTVNTVNRAKLLKSKPRGLSQKRKKNQKKNENLREEVKIQRMSNGLPRLLSRYERIYLRYQGPAICNALNTKAAGPPSVPHRLQPGQGPGPGDARPPVHQVHLRGQEAPDLGENISNSADYSRWRHQWDSSRASECCGESLSSL